MSSLADLVAQSKKDYENEKERLRQGLGPVDKPENARKRKRKDTWNANLRRSDSDVKSSTGLASKWAISAEEDALIRKSLQRKARLYNNMHKHGSDMMLTAQQANMLLVDFDRKFADGHFDPHEKASDDELGVKEDPFIEVIDEFGRSRTIRTSHRMHYARPEEDLELPQPEQVIRGDHMQRFKPDLAKKDLILQGLRRETEAVACELQNDGRRGNTTSIEIEPLQDRQRRFEGLQARRHGIRAPQQEFNRKHDAGRRSSLPPWRRRSAGTQNESVHD
ncbi:hypothetical protein PYCC9005_000308 [Savitreella phatthalungensis]